MTAKTNAAVAEDMGFPPRAQAVGVEEAHGLLTKAAASAARKRIRAAVAEHHGRVVRARNAAWQALHREPRPTQAVAEAGGSDDHAVNAHGSSAEDQHDGGDDWVPHYTHALKAPNGPSLVYCDACGAWSVARKCTRRLTLPCTRGGAHKGNLRLLALGIPPTRGGAGPSRAEESR